MRYTSLLCALIDEKNMGENPRRYAGVFGADGGKTDAARSVGHQLPNATPTRPTSFGEHGKKPHVNKHDA